MDTFLKVFQIALIIWQVIYSAVVSIILVTIALFILDSANYKNLSKVLDNYTKTLEKS